KMRGSKGISTESGSVAGTNEREQVSSTNLEKEGVVYVCPMPEHVSITYDHPGNCPICGMALVPVTPSELKQLQPGGKVLYYTCPMPEHNYIHEDKPGKCPICGMTLIPVMAPPDTATNPVPVNADSPIQQSSNPPTQNATTNPASSNTNSAFSTKPAAKQLYT